MKCLDLFSGIGGFALACQWAGIETVAFCEIEPYCQAVLKKHWPLVPCHDDIRTLQGKDYEGIDFICGGFPCQPYSVAGKRRGAADDRDLWPSMYRVIVEAHPRWVCAENTPGFLSVGLDRAASALEDCDYETGAIVLPAISKNAPHIRQRLFLIAHSQRDNLRFEPGRIGGTGREDQIQPSCNGSSQFDTDPESARLALSGGRSREETTPTRPSDHDGWATKSPVGGVAHGISNRVDRLKALGNAVVPQIVEIIGRAILEAERGEVV